MKTYLITGASDGIGRSIALKLSERKENLILFGRDGEKLHSVKAACEASGASAQAYAFDLTDHARRRVIIKEILSEQPVDVLINNAGIWHNTGDLTSLSEGKIQEVINLNLTAQILLTRQLLDRMRGHEGAAIINIVSRSGLAARAGQSVYAASKFGLRGFTDALREDTKSEPLRIGAVYQAGTNTGMFAKAGEDFETQKYTEPDDLAEVVVFMLTRPKKIWLNEVQVAY
jgi:short-subunit dehydrogenase